MAGLCYEICKGLWLDGMKYKHLFFDLDRTLWDFETNSHESLTELFHEHDLANKGIDSHHEFIKEYKRINEHYWGLYRLGQIEKEELRTVRFQRTLEHFDIIDIDLAHKVGQDYLEVTPKKPGLLPNAIEVLDALQTRYCLHIITNGFEEVQEVKMQHSGLQGYFDEVITSERVGKKKPDPDVFRFALDLAKAKSNESLMIGDDLPVDVLGARECGMDQIYFNPEKLSHREHVTYEISDLQELLEIL